jgi:hypothetical protein
MRTKLSLYNTISAVALQIVNLNVNLICRRDDKVYGSEVNGLVTSNRQFITYSTWWRQPGGSGSLCA